MWLNVVDVLHQRACSSGWHSATSGPAAKLGLQGPCIFDINRRKTCYFEKPSNLIECGGRFAPTRVGIAQRKSRRNWGVGLKELQVYKAPSIGPCVPGSSANCTRPTQPKLILFLYTEDQPDQTQIWTQKANRKIGLAWRKAGPAELGSGVAGDISTFECLYCLSSWRKETLSMWYCVASFETEHDLNEHMISVHAGKEPFSVWSRLCWRVFFTNSIEKTFGLRP